MRASQQLVARTNAPFAEHSEGAGMGSSIERENTRHGPYKL